MRLPLACWLGCGVGCEESDSRTMRVGRASFCLGSHCLDCLDLHYAKPKREPANEERYNWPVPETLLGQNNRTLRTENFHRTSRTAHVQVDFVGPGGAIGLDYRRPLLRALSETPPMRRCRPLQCDVVRVVGRACHCHSCDLSGKKYASGPEGSPEGSGGTDASTVAEAPGKIEG